MARASMAALISQLRLLIHDPSGGDAVFTDDELQTFLDGRRTEHRYEQLQPVETRAAGGAVSYLAYRASVGWWETDAALTDGDYATLTPSAADYATGRWTFSAHQDAPVYIVGYAYDMTTSAVDALSAWLATLKTSYDFTADGASFRRSQQAAMVEGLLRRYESQRGPETATNIRNDVM